MALAEVATGKPLRSVAGKYGMDEGTRVSIPYLSS